MSEAGGRRGDDADHWAQVWSTRDPADTSWYEADASSFEMVRPWLGPGASVLDVGGGASVLVDALLAEGVRDVTVLDISSEALDHARRRLGDAAADVEWVVADVTAWEPDRTWSVWHDRAVLHFLVGDDQVDRYVSALAAAVEPGGAAVISTFAPHGPTECSGRAVRRWSGDDLLARLSPWFEPFDTTVRDHHTPWAAAQAFTVVRAVRRS